MSDEPRYAVGDLAALGGVSRRTVRYYVQEGLIAAPFGIGRGNHYGPAHLQQLLRVKALQEGGRTLDDIKRASGAKARARQRVRSSDEGGTPRRTIWRRIVLSPGVELHVAADVHLPSPGKLLELASWCRLHMPAAPTSPDDK
jgi:DNA-binding transcriptional MerR regulator